MIFMFAYGFFFSIFKVCAKTQDRLKMEPS